MKPLASTLTNTSKTFIQIVFNSNLHILARVPNFCKRLFKNCRRRKKKSCMTARSKKQSTNCPSIDALWCRPTNSRTFPPKWRRCSRRTRSWITTRTLWNGSLKADGSPHLSSRELYKVPKSTHYKVLKLSYKEQRVSKWAVLAWQDQPRRLTWCPESIAYFHNFELKNSQNRILQKTKCFSIANTTLLSWRSNLEHRREFDQIKEDRDRKSLHVFP